MTSHPTRRSEVFACCLVVVALLACKKFAERLEAQKEEAPVAATSEAAGASPAAPATPATALSWQKLEDADGAFRVELPGTAKHQTEQTPTAVGNIELHMFLVESAGGSAFTAMYSDYPKSIIRAANADKILEGAQNGAVTNINGKLDTQRKIKIGSHPGREFSAKASTPLGGELEYTSRIYLVKNRLYQVTLAALGGTVAEADKKRFFDSFALL